MLSESERVIETEQDKAVYSVQQSVVVAVQCRPVVVSETSQMFKFLDDFKTADPPDL